MVEVEKIAGIKMDIPPQFVETMKQFSPLEKAAGLLLLAHIKLRDSDQISPIANDVLEHALSHLMARIDGATPERMDLFVTTQIEIEKILLQSPEIQAVISQHEARDPETTKH